MGDTSKISVTRKVASLPRVSPTLLLSCEVFDLVVVYYESIKRELLFFSLSQEYKYRTFKPQPSIWCNKFCTPRILFVVYCNKDTKHRDT
jgi:hypothetical protein